MNRTGTIRVLIDAGADINAANKRGWTPLHLAASAGLEEAVEVLLARGADTDCQDLRGRTPLHLAVSHGAEITRMLIEKGAGLEIKSRTGLTPLHSAVVVSSAESVVELIKAGADLEAEENLGRNAMGLARTYHNEEIIELLADPEKARKKVFEKKPCHHRHEHEDEELDLDKIELNGD